MKITPSNCCVSMPARGRGEYHRRRRRRHHITLCHDDDDDDEDDDDEREPCIIIKGLVSPRTISTSGGSSSTRIFSPGRRLARDHCNEPRAPSGESRERRAESGEQRAGLVGVGVGGQPFPWLSLTMMYVAPAFLAPSIAATTSCRVRQSGGERTTLMRREERRAEGRKGSSRNLCHEVPEPAPAWA